VDRSFEFDSSKTPILKRQKDIKLFVEWFFNYIDDYEKNNFDKIRLLPEIKLYVRYKLFDGEIKKEKRWEKEVEAKKRFYKDVYKASFLFELNPLWIGQNSKEEINCFKKKLIDNKKNLYYIWIDIWTNELVTLWVYNQNLESQDIEVDDKKQKIIDLTNLKLDNWKIITIKWNNSEKHRAIKDMFKQILLWQIYLKDVLEKIGELDIKKENYWNIKQHISKYYKFNRWNKKFWYKCF